MTVTNDATHIPRQFMTPIIRLLATLLAVGIFAPVAQAKLNVVATTPDFGAIAQEIGGKQVSVTVLARPTEDPHFVDAKPSFIVKLNRADVLIEGAAELELGWLPPLVQGARNAKILPGAPGRISGSQGIAMLEVPATLDRSKGDIHAAGNPHYMTDPANARIVAQHIADVFGKLDPQSAAAYHTNLARFLKRLDEKLTEWQGRLAPYQGGALVSYHNMWPYFAKRFGLKIELFLEPKPGIPPTPQHLAGVIGKMRSEKIRLILVEPFQSRKTAETVAASTGATVLSMTQYPGGVKGTEGGYIELMDYLVGAVARGFASTR